MEDTMKALNLTTLLLVIIGGINWGLMGLFQFDLVATLFGGPTSTLSRLIYILVGISAVYQLVPLIQALSAGEVRAQSGLTGRAGYDNNRL
jgi:uncharacterized protein